MAGTAAARRRTAVHRTLRCVIIIPFCNWFCAFDAIQGRRFPNCVEVHSSELGNFVAGAPVEGMSLKKGDEP